MSLVQIYVAPGFEEVELVTIADILRRCDIPCELVSLSEELTVVGAHQISIVADQAFSTASANADLIVLPGGGPGTAALMASTELHQRLLQQIQAQKRVAAICAAPVVLAKIGILEGKNACCYPGCEATLLDGGANMTAYNVTTDGLITTSRGAATAALFALELARLLQGPEIAQEVGRAMLYL